MSTKRDSDRIEILQETLDLLIFQTLRSEPAHEAQGREQLAVETTKWDKLAGAIARILRPAPQEGE